VHGAGGIGTRIAAVRLPNENGRKDAAVTSSIDAVGQEEASPTAMADLFEGSAELEGQDGFWGREIASTVIGYNKKLDNMYYTKRIGGRFCRAQGRKEIRKE
jgi:hypothetical protein